MNIQNLQYHCHSDLKAQLEQQEKMASLGLLTAGIAHEVQNPLNFVINFSRISAKLVDDLNDVLSDCAEKVSEDDAAEIDDICTDLKENMQKIQEHGERALSIIHGILLQSRGKAGEFLPVDIQQLVHEYVWLSYHAMRAQDKSFNISIHEEYQSDMPKMMVVPQDLSRAILNVMNNACYTVKERTELGDDYNPQITVRVTFDSPTLTIAITDNGMGMSKELQEKIFENFYTTKPVGQGTGLGMGIIRDIVTKEHNGELLLESEPGKGTTITFRIQQ